MKDKYIKTESGQIMQRELAGYFKRNNLKKGHFTSITCMFDAYNIVAFHLSNENLPLHTLAERIALYNPNFKCYPDGIDDSHIKTFLKGFFKTEKGD